ncbi:MAG: WD40 repeat domain-containing protein [Candidatus Kariarchaeaceae archaeon]|jgi:WD40 repeat protein
MKAKESFFVILGILLILSSLFVFVIPNPINNENIVEISVANSFTIESIVWNSQGTHIAGIANESSVIIWQFQDNQLSQSKVLSINNSISLAWHSSDQILAISSQDGRVKFWDISHDVIVEEWLSLGSYANSIDWHPEGNWLALGYNDGRIIIRSFDTGAIINQLETMISIRSIKFSPNGHILSVLYGTHSSSYWDITSGEINSSNEVHLGYEGAITTTAISISSNSQKIVLASSTLLMILRLSDKVILQSWDTSNQNLDEVKWNPVDNKIAWEGSNGELTIRDGSSGESIARTHVSSEHLNSFSWSPNGKFLAIGDNDAILSIWLIKHQYNSTVKLLLGRLLLSTGIMISGIFFLRFRK